MNWNCTCVLDQCATSGDLPQFGHRVLATWQNVLWVFGENGWADLSPIMCFLKRAHTSVGDAVPQLDAAILAACDIGVGSWVVAHTADGICMLIQRVARHKTLERIDIVKAQCWMLCAHQQVISWRVEGDGAQHFRFLQRKKVKPPPNKKNYNQNPPIYLYIMVSLSILQLHIVCFNHIGFAINSV